MELVFVIFVAIAAIVLVFNGAANGTGVKQTIKDELRYTSPSDKEKMATMRKHLKDKYK